MRTKITILSAAALAAGLLSSHAQVFSANVVGYYNVSLAPKKSTLVTGQLPSSGTATTLNNDMVNFDDQNAADGSVLLIWNGAAFTTYTFVGPANGGPAWADQGGNATTNSLPLGTSAFLQNPGTVARTITFVGQVVQGTVTNKLNLGSFFYALSVPIATNVDSTIGNMNTASTDGDVLLHWNPASGPSGGVGAYDAVYTFVSAANGGPAWADQGGNQAFPIFKVGEGFSYQHLGGASNWISSFTVQ